MRNALLVLPSVVVAVLSWGLHGPLLQRSQQLLGATEYPSGLRALICVGIAYFLVAVTVPILVLRLKGESGRWSMAGTFWALAAGGVGAIGALAIILAFRLRAKPVYVMPLVFGLAPVVNTLLYMLFSNTLRSAGRVFYAGVALIAVGVVGVLYFKPVPNSVTVEVEAGGSITITHYERMTPQNGGQTEQRTTWTAGSLQQLQSDPAYAQAYALYLNAQALPLLEFGKIMGLIFLAAICWGSYGPLLHKGQKSMGGSRMRPFLCLGLAYLAVAVVVPLALSSAVAEPGAWSLPGLMWGISAGIASALGALGLVLAFHFGGKPSLVMPLVFGLAPVANTLAIALPQGAVDQVTTTFAVSLTLLIGGAVLVLASVPKAVGQKRATKAKSEQRTAPGGSQDQPKPEAHKPVDAEANQPPPIPATGNQPMREVGEETFDPDETVDD